jgi:hypothetical protein
MGKQDEAPDPAMFRGAGVSNMLAEMDALRQQYANFCLSLCVGGFYDPAFCHFRMNRKRGV